MRRFVHILLVLTAFLLTVPAETATAAAAPKRKARTTAVAKRKARANAAPRTATSVKTEKSRTQKEIADTRNKLTATKKQTRKVMEELEGIDAGIRRQEIEISVLNVQLDSLQGAISCLSDSIAVLEKRTRTLRHDLKETLRNMRRRRKSISDVAFVFAAPSFSAAVSRVKYLDQLNRWRASKIKRLQDEMKLLADVRTGLAQVREQQASAMSRLNASRQTLELRRRRQQESVNYLRGQTQSLNALLSEKQKRMRQLDNELDRIIAAEQERRRRQEEAERRAKVEAERRAKAEAARKAKAEAEAARRAREKENEKDAVAEAPPKNDAGGKAADEKPPVDAGAPAKAAPKPAQNSRPVISGVAREERELSGSFAANRGNLLFPVAGKYSVVGNFGRSEHRNISNVQVNNSGIDIAVSPGSTARAVFDGTVSSVFFMPGYGNIVILRHGQYLTVYAGLSSLSVKKGSKVKGGTPLGRIQPDSNDSSRALLHFEVRHEREKLNPLDWVR